MTTATAAAAFETHVDSRKIGGWRNSRAWAQTGPHPMGAGCSHLLLFHRSFYLFLSSFFKGFFSFF